MITHSKRTMAMADVLYGVTMQESGISKRVGPYRHTRAKQWRDDLTAEQRLVALIVGMRDERHAGGN